MIDWSDLDFMIVATPTGLHAEIVKYAINKGLHVFVEKPFLLNSAQGRELVAMLDGSDLVGQVGYVALMIFFLCKSKNCSLPRPLVPS